MKEKFRCYEGIKWEKVLWPHLPFVSFLTFWGSIQLKHISDNFTAHSN